MYMYIYDILCASIPKYKWMRISIVLVHTCVICFDMLILTDCSARPSDQLAFHVPPFRWYSFCCELRCMQYALGSLLAGLPVDLQLLWHNCGT